LTYDAYNHLTSYGTLLTATYRGDDLRASKSTANGTTYFVYDGTTPVLELNGAGAPTAWNTFGPLGLLSRWNITPTNSYSRFYLFDATGNVVNRQDAWQTALSSCLYDAYGKWADPNTAEGADPFGYQGQAGYYGDIETGLYLCTFRYYEPREGRWLNEDPLGYDGGVNLYGYVGGDPVGGTDPVGLYRLIVYGSDKGVPFSWTLHQFFKHLDGPGAGPMVVQLFQPSKRELLPYLIRADSFYFWGHGSPPGELMLNNDEWFGADDLKGVMQTRCRQRVPKMTDVALHSCYGMSEPFLVNRWLQISDRVSGFKGLTTHIWTWRQTSRPWEISPRSFYDYLNPRGRR
ncbi:MAG TPA: RHS repeat-associated core domain-containing protein, partial [Armatimonadota bacterium]